jgi:hypothetical protein
MKLRKRILKGIKHFKADGVFYTECDTSLFKPVKFLVSGYWIEVPPETYIFDDGEDYCFLGFVP